MKLIWHIIKKDMVRLRWPLTGWLLLFVLQIGAGLALLWGDGADPDLPPTLQLWAAALIAVQMAAGFLLVSLLVHEDRLIGTGVAWMTRPISGGRLLLAKLLGAGLMFGLLPVFIMIPWWLLCGFGWSEMWRAGAAALFWQMLMIIPAMWLASITDTVGRLLMWTLVGVVGLVAATLMIAVQNRNLGSPELAMAQIRVAVAILMVTGLGVTAHQYLTRRLVRSVAMTVLGVGVAVLALQFWPWSLAEILAKPGRAAPTAASLPVEGIKITQVRAAIEKQFSKDSTTRLSMTFWLDGVPKDAGLLGLLVRHEWRWPDGLVVTRTGRFSEYWWPTTGLPAKLGQSLSLREPEKDEETERWREEVLNKARSSARYQYNPTHEYRRMLHDSPQVPASLAQRMLTDAPAYSGVILAALTRADPIVKIPFGDRRRHHNVSQTLRITRTGPDKHDTIAVNVIVTVPSWAVGERQSLSRLIGTMRIDPSHSPHEITAIDTPFLVSRATGETRELIGRGLASAQICGVTLSWNKFQAQQPKVRRGDKWVARYENWFAGTSFCVIRAREVARTTREIRVERFSLKPRPDVRDDQYAD